MLHEFTEDATTACTKSGYHTTDELGGKQLCIKIGTAFSCNIIWSPPGPASTPNLCIPFSCGGGGTYKLVAAVKVCYEESDVVINFEFKICVRALSGILKTIGKWIPGTEAIMNKFNIYGGCYRLVVGKYNTVHTRIQVVSPTHTVKPVPWLPNIKVSIS